MAWHKALLRLRAALVIVMFLVSHTRADDLCIWCDPGLSQQFVDCVSASILDTPDFSNVPASSIDDMKNSMLAAAGAMKRSSSSLKMSMMNGAMAGELAELVKAQSVSQDPDTLVKILITIVGNCYVKVSGQPHHKFTGVLGSTVNSMLQANTDSGGQASNPLLPQFPPTLDGQNINPYNNNNNPDFQQQQTPAASQVTLNAASQNYQGAPLNGGFFYSNAAQNYQVPPANIQRNAQTYAINNQQNIPRQLNFGGGSYPFNAQNKWRFRGPNGGRQPNVNLNNNDNNNQNGVPNNAAPLLQNNQFPVITYDQNNQRYPIANTNNQLTFTPNGQGILQNQLQNTNANGGTLNQRNVYPSNRAAISIIQTGKSAAPGGSQPNLNNSLPAVTKSPSSVVINSAITTGKQVNIKPQPNIRLNTTKRRRRPKRPRTKTPSPQVTPATVTNMKVTMKGSRADVENAIKFAETIYFILCRSKIFTGTFNTDLPKDDAVSLIFNVMQNALKDGGYSKFAQDIANACVVSLTSRPGPCASEIYAEAIAKSVMTRFYKMGLIGNRPGDQASSLAISILKQLKQLVLGAPSDSTTTIPSTDSTTSIPPTDSTTIPSTDSTTVPSTDSPITTTSSNTDASITAQDSSPSDNADINTQFYNALYDSLYKSLYFQTLFSKQAKKSDVILWTAKMLISLSKDYGRQIMIITVRECAKRIATLPDDYSLELLVKVICSCITDKLSDNGLISQVSPVDQAKSIASKFDVALINIINQITDNNAPVNNSQPQNTGNIPVNNTQPQNTGNIPLNNNSQPQNTGNIPVNNLKLQQTANIPVLNSKPQNTNNGQTTDNYPTNSTQLQNTGNVPGNNLQLQQTANIPFLNSKIYARNRKRIPQRAANNKQPKLKPVNSIANANLNAGMYISKRNNVSPGNQVIQDINNGNTPSTQIFPDDDSDESKQRIQILMKWAISSIDNGKFNYKVFSSVISALAKFLQKTNPDLGAQKALFKVLLESIVALTQLLVQVPPSTLAIQNAPNSNGPNLLNTNVGDIKANVPLLQNSNMPSSQNANAPLLQNGNIPFLQNGNAPVLQNADVPNPQNTNNAPILQNANAPNPQNGNNAPILQNANTPIPSPDIIQNNQNYPRAQQNNYNNGQINRDAFATGVNNYASQQDFQYNYGSSQQFDGNIPGQTWNNGNLDGQGSQNSFLPVQSSYTFQQGPTPGQGNLVMNGQNNFPPSQGGFGVSDVNGNFNRAPYDVQSGINDPNLNQQNGGSYFAGNPNQNAFLQNNNMQAGYQNYGK